MISPTAIINLNHLQHNIKYLKSLCGSTKLYPVVKADAYGHGITKIFQFLSVQSIEGVCVATCSEILEIAILNLNMNILHLGRISLTSKKLFNNKIIFTINCMDDINYIKDVCREKNKKIRCYIKVDTGMNRMGCKESDFIKIFKQAISSKYIKLEGIYSHLACAEDRKSKNNKAQINLFQKIINLSKDFNLKYHILNSAGLFNYSDSKYDIVRCGLSVYGISSFGKPNDGLLPVMTLKAPVVLTKRILKNESVGYGCTYIAKESKKIAIVQCGYADGIPRSFGNSASVYYDSYVFPIIGKISMDLICIDISSMINSETLKEVIIWGGEQYNSRLEIIADKYDSIPYVYLTGLSNRVEKIYIEE
tara:strand:- start:261 stop:1352 length:1092 start_codon:yes stop_codon:yes gene_type:complete